MRQGDWSFEGRIEKGRVVMKFKAYTQHIPGTGILDTTGIIRWQTVTSAFVYCCCI
jgi:hypothetical protein